MQKLLSRMERLPSLPVLYTQVTAELAKPEASIQFVGRLIAKDPAMTAKILQMVNSAVFSLQVEITDPGEAVLYLGAERTKSLILLASVSLRFEKCGCTGFSHPQLWQHSMAVGASAQAITLAQTKDVKLAEMAFTAGLLHDIGKLLLAANMPDAYSQVLARVEGTIHSVTEMETEVLGASHAELGASVLGTWGLPVSILEAIAWHHCPNQSDDRSFSPLTAVHAANALEQEKLLSKSGSVVSQIDSPYLQRLRLVDRCDSWRKSCGLNMEKM
jgi:putative nucleotidyltransferase with HDIG domain